MTPTSIPAMRRLLPAALLLLALPGALGGCQTIRDLTGAISPGDGETTATAPAEITAPPGGPALPGQIQVTQGAPVDPAGGPLVASTPRGVGVNGFLWRAALDTVAFLPVTSADPFGGVILTDWYAPPETPDERFKLNVYVLDSQLRADAIRVAVFRQQRTGGGWRDVAVAADTALNVENAILTRARQLRISQVGAK